MNEPEGKLPTSKRLAYDDLGREIRTGSSRAAIILAVAAIDDLLRVAIVLNFIKLSRKDEDNIFTGNGPLSPFSSRIKVAYAMGLISRKLRSDLDRLRKIRNDYAHKTLEMSLEDEDQDEAIRGLNAASDIRDAAQLPVKEILARSVETISLYLILRTSPPSMAASAEFIAELRCLDYSNSVEAKRRAHSQPYQSR